METEAASQEEMAFSEWAEKLESGTNHWLPAYGFQQPSQFHEALLQHDYLTGESQQGYVYLETIVEETSDDLKSESDYSESATGWPDTDSDAGSVIHIPNNIGQSKSNAADWSGSERDIAVPKKRRKRATVNNDPGVNDDDDDDDSDEFPLPPYTTRSGSLLQFEQLEKQCDTVFRASASSEQFVHSPSITSSFSFDSLETSRWRSCESPDSLNEASSLSSSCSSSSELTSSSGDDNLTRSFSSRSGNDSFKSSLRSHRSFDSLVTSQQDKLEKPVLSGEFSQSLNNTVVVVEEEPEPVVAPPRGLYKTVECLTQTGFAADLNKPELAQEKKTGERGRGQRSAENLSEDSGFGEHIPRGGSLRRASSSGVFTIAENDDDSSSYGSTENTLVKIEDAEDEEEEEEDDEVAKVATVDRGWNDVGSNYSAWQSAPDLLKFGSSQLTVCREETNRSETDLDKPSVGLASTRPITSTTSLVTFTIKDEDEFLVIPEKKSFLKEMNCKHPVVSTPNLYTEKWSRLEDGEFELKFSGEEPKALTRAQSFRETNLKKTSSRGSNIQITTSFINLTTSERSIGGSSKGVHFSPVVSEVSWRDSDHEDDWDGSEVDLDRARNDNRRWSGFREEEELIVKELMEEPKNRRADTGEWGRHPPPPPPPRTHQVQVNKQDPYAGDSVPPVVPVNCVGMEPRGKSKGGIGGFFHRFSLRRLSGRDKKRKEMKKEALKATTNQVPVQTTQVNSSPDDIQYIPLRPPLRETQQHQQRSQENRPQKPPPPPPPVASSTFEQEDYRLGRRRRVSPPPEAASVMSDGARAGLLETDLDSAETSPSTINNNNNKKARSLLNLGETTGGGGGRIRRLNPSTCSNQQSSCAASDQDNRARSMEFLLDKENHFAVKPPENELQKVGERVMSEHELRVQRSLQKLNVPDWYKNSAVPAQGFLLKRHSDGNAGTTGGPTGGGWQGLQSKTTSLSSLGSSHHATPRSPTGNLMLSPTPSGGHTFSRWSTSRLNSNPTSSNTSPCGSARSSFNYRQPYLGWRSQERLTNPRTPAERLAAGILPLQKQSQQNVPNLSEVHSSIKEVTSAIVHYVSGSRGDDRLSPALIRHDNSSSKSASPRGSTGRLCWVESSFVGNKPIDVPETPVSLTATPEHGKPGDLFLDLASTHRPKMTAVNGLAGGEGDEDGEMASSLAGEAVVNRPSPNSTTMEEVLDSLLGLAPPSRTPSPSLARRSCSDIANHLAGSASSGGNDPIQFIGEVTSRRYSEGNDSSAENAVFHQQRGGRRVSFDMAVTEGEVVRCRYNKCNKTAPLAEAKKTFKTCHNCTHVYCSRECRRSHWEKHRKTCLHSRVGALCRKVMTSVKEDEETLHHISLVARRGYLSKGRGAVKVLFSKPQNAEDFIDAGCSRLGDPTFVKWSDFQPEEMGKEMHEELIRLCKTYNPDTRLILYIAVCVVSEVPSIGASVKWEMQMVSRCAKLKLSKGLSPVDITRDDNEPDTLILTSLPGARDQGSQKARQISFTNIQRHLRQRGISLRRQFPEVYQRLCSYVEGTSERFVPMTIYPRDVTSGKNFMCIIMPDAEPEKLELIPDSSRVQTIDISVEPLPAL